MGSTYTNHTVALLKNSLTISMPIFLQTLPLFKIKSLLEQVFFRKFTIQDVLFEVAFIKDGSKTENFLLPHQDSLILHSNKSAVFQLKFGDSLNRDSKSNFRSIKSPAYNLSHRLQIELPVTSKVEKHYCKTFPKSGIKIFQRNLFASSRKRLVPA